MNYTKYLNKHKEKYSEKQKQEEENILNKIKSLETKRNVIIEKIKTLNKPFSCNSKGDFRRQAPVYNKLYSSLSEAKDIMDKASIDTFNSKVIWIMKITLTFFFVYISFRTLAEASDILHKVVIFPIFSLFGAKQQIFLSLDFLLQDLLAVTGLSIIFSNLFRRVKYFRTIQFSIISAIGFFICLVIFTFIEIQ